LKLAVHDRTAPGYLAMTSPPREANCIWPSASAADVRRLKSIPVYTAVLRKTTHILLYHTCRSVHVEPPPIAHQRGTPDGRHLKFTNIYGGTTNITST